MFEDTKDENEETVAYLAEGETLITDQMVDADKESDETWTESLAEELGIDATISVVEDVQDNVISSPEPVEDSTPAIVPDDNGVIGSGKMKKSTPKKTSAPRTKKVKDEEKPATAAVFSTRNVTWTGVGKVYRGYNIVSEEAAEKWLTRDHIRLATPEEVAQEFGK